MSAKSKSLCDEITTISADHHSIIQQHCPRCMGLPGGCLAERLKEAAQLPHVETSKPHYVERPHYMH